MDQLSKSLYEDNIKKPPSFFRREWKFLVLVGSILFVGLQLHSIYTELKEVKNDIREINRSVIFIEEKTSWIGHNSRSLMNTLEKMEKFNASGE